MASPGVLALFASQRKNSVLVSSLMKFRTLVLGLFLKKKVMVSESDVFTQLWSCLLCLF